MSDPCCDPNLSRRGFLGLSLGGYLGLSMGGSLLGGLGLSRAAAQDAGKIAGFGQAKRCVILWLNGGPSQRETWDPKPGTPFGGPTKAIATKAKGVEISENFPRLAEHMDKVALVRSMATREGNHQRARYFLHTGYVPSGTVKHPDVGSLLCQQLADTAIDMPPYLVLNGATPGAGILGVSYAPFVIQDPTKPVDNLAYADGISEERFSRRRELLSALDASFRESRPGPETAGHAAIVAKADRLMHSPKIAAFQLEQEPQAVRAAYGPGKFGSGVLMARRLLEQGVKVVEVQLNGWDTHRDNFTKVRELGGEVDLAFSALITDLEQRDLLSSTLIVCMGEFGRTPRVNPNDGRDHWARSWSMALAGGPIRGGTVVGSTSPDGTQVERPVQTEDLMATICHAMGVDREYTNYTKEGRPIATVDAKGKLIREVFPA